MADIFSVSLPTPGDGAKDFEIDTPFEGVKITLDYDDVDHEATEILAVLIVQTLNKHLNLDVAKKCIEKYRAVNEKEKS